MANGSLLAVTTSVRLGFWIGMARLLREAPLNSIWEGAGNIMALDLMRALKKRGGAAGDLYAEIKVMVPPKPTAREHELFEQLAAVSTFDPRRGR